MIIVKKPKSPKKPKELVFFLLGERRQRALRRGTRAGRELRSVDGRHFDCVFGFVEDGCCSRVVLL